MLSCYLSALRCRVFPGERPPSASRGARWAQASWARRSGIIIIAAIVAFAGITPARADFNTRDGQILGRTLGYVGDGMSGTAILGIVFIPGDPSSRREAEAIRIVIGSGLTAGRVRLQASLIPVDQLAVVIGVNALYVTAGLTGSMNAVSGTALRLHIPTVSIDMACVQSGNCVVGFSSEPTVKIVIDHAAAERAGMHFLQAFRMLVRER